MSSIQTIHQTVAGEVINDSRLTLLMLDDEEDILKALHRVLRKEYQLVSFTRGEEALAYLKESPVDIILSDMKMPAMNGAQFLAEARRLQPNAVRLLLTGFSELDAAIDAINHGGIYSYLSKPWDNNALRLSLKKASEFIALQKERDQLLQNLEERNQQLATANSSLEQKVAERTQRLVSANSRLETLLQQHRSLYKDLLAMLSGAVEYRAAATAGHVERLARQSHKVAIQLGLSEPEANNIYISAILHEIGLLAMRDGDYVNIDLATENLHKQGKSAGLSNIDKKKLAIIERTLKMLQSLNRFQPHQVLIRHQDENFDGTGVPEHLRGESIPFGSRIIRVVRDYEKMVTGQGGQDVIAPDVARQHLRSFARRIYDPRVVEAFLKIQKERPQNDSCDVEYCIGVEELQPGQILRRDFVLGNGKTMLTAGSKLTAETVERIRGYAKQNDKPLVLSVS